MKVAIIYLCRATREFDQPYSYLVPDELAVTLEVGCLVEIPFGRGNSVREGWVCQISELYKKPTHALKSIIRILSPTILRYDHFALAKEMRRRYFCSISQALQVMAPPSIVKSGERTQRCSALKDVDEVIELLEEGTLRSHGQVRVLEFLLAVGEASLQEIMATCQVSRSVLDGLRKKNLIYNFNKEVTLETRENPKLESGENKEHNLNVHQAKALAKILDEKPAGEISMRELLLYGVTGSGKTEVYLRAADSILKQNRDVIILVPEISLTPLICERIERRFGKSAAILHSRLSPSERFEQWKSIRSGEKHLVAGARSAIFAPLKNIGLIIIDEEQETTYKSERTPRYHASDIARIRSTMHGATLLLASATPSVVSYERTCSKRSELLVLPERAGGAMIPKTTIVNMRDEYAHDSKTVISRDLEESLILSFAQQQQAMIFLNRRGHSSFLLCRDCGYIHTCTECEISMTEHKNPRRWSQSQLICHYCGRIEELPDTCPECSSHNFGRFGVGTQQVEILLQEMFPEQKFLRMDMDTTTGRTGHAEILSAFANHEADCLIGTQMIAKGHDFGKVTTVGVLSADLMLGQDDYAAEERAFQLICQAAGRAGRHDLPGRVFIQSFNPENIALQLAARQDYEAFYPVEIEKRKVLKYPPFCDIGLILCSSRQERKVEEEASRLYEELRFLLRQNNLEKKIQVYPPHPAPIARLRGRWRYRIIVKSTSLGILTRSLTYINDLKNVDGVSVTCDINPTRMA